MAEVHYSSLASDDLIENVRYIALDKPAAAFQWVDEIESTCVLLSKNPEMGEVRDTNRFGNCRSFSLGNYVIFFRAVSDGVEIIRIVRAERDIDNL